MKIHIVKSGDSLYSIGQKYNVSLEEILKLNPGISNPDVIEVGMKLKIPSTHTGGSGGGMDIMHQHVVKQGDTLWKLSKAWGVPLADMIKANPQLKNPNVLLTGEVVNIPKVSDTGHGGTGGHSVGQGGNGMGTLHPTSVMQNVQGWVGKLSTAPITGKTPTGPITGKTPTAPIAPAPVAPVQQKPVAPVEQKPAAPIQQKPAAPIVKPVKPAPLPAPKAAAVEPAKKALPIEKPVEKKLQPIHSEYKPNVDLFKQYGIPATEALSLYDLPKAPESVSPVQQQPAFGGYGYGHPMTMPAQTGHGYGYGGWQQPVPFGSTVSPLGEGNEAPFDCPPGTVFVGSYPSPSTLPTTAGPGWGYGYHGVNPLQQDVNENSHLVAGAAAMPNQSLVSPFATHPNQGMVSPFAAHPNQGMVSPFAAQPNQGMVSPLAVQPNQGMVSPLAAQPNQGIVSPFAAQPNQGMVSPFAAQPNQGMVSPLAVQPNQGMVAPFAAQPNQGFVSPANFQPDYGYGYGYGGQSMIMPAQAQHDNGYGYGYPSYPPYPGWPQTAGANDANQADCGCKGNRSDQNTEKQVELEQEKPIKTVVQRKNAKKAVIRTVSSRPNKTKNRGNQPWLNR
ncbi:LysM peptidoglycan-binding domain-containing protein [Paenibacillus sinopodophylli]|uniref:LysM peptidoglycan-binding domain-containing protein n=1 Tax=Paenibacillus sinopodophylli TaxID=1837342 RepID=UPI00110D06A6|nr:LysM peptidoglycan-binding domain-containing protein [Paenibacillus sinopodophylli]